MPKENLNIKEIYTLAIQNHKKDNFETAERLYKEILEKDPNQFDSIYLLGILSAQSKKIETAKQLFKKAIKIKPNEPKLHYNLGLAFKELGEFKKAISSYKKAIEIDPKYFIAHNNLGNVFDELGKIEQAKNSYENTIKINKNFEDAHYNLGLIFHKLGEHEKARNCYEEAIKINPDFLNAHLNLGILFEKLFDYNKAQNCYERTIEINQNFSLGHYNLGNVLEELGEYKKAINSYERAIKNKPDYIEAYNNLALVFKQLGDIQKAISCYEKAAECKSDNLVSLYYLYELKTEILDSKLYNKILKIIDKLDCSKENKTFGNFLLSKYELNNRNYDKEFNYLLKSHSNYLDLKKNSITKEIDYWLKQLPNAQGLIESIKGYKNYKENNYEIKPIFIFGIPRCGSTLLEKVIASGAQHISIGEETNVFRDSVIKIIEKNSFVKLDFYNLQKEIIMKFKKKSLIEKKSNFIFTDKSLDNFFYIGLINKIFPNAKFINCKRNIVSSIMSIFKTNYKDIPWGHSLEHIFKYIDIYKKIIKNLKHVAPNLIYDLEYEKFINNPEEESKKLFVFCDLPWDKKCLEFYKREDVISKTASKFQIKRPIYQGSGEQYVHYRKFLNKFEKKYDWFDKNIL